MVKAPADPTADTHREDVGSARGVLAKAGLQDLMCARPGDGLVLAGSTGVGCLFGHAGRTDMTVDVAGAILDAGCLPAPS
ncbi:hypothetical protein ACFQX7_19270 [Luedemannella flava]